jgi:hypothetical protein
MLKVVAALAGLSIIGLIVLLAINKDVSALVPVVTALVAFLVGAKREEIIAGVKRLR